MTHLVKNVLAPTLFVGLLIGCSPSEEIETYTVPRTTAPREPLDVAEYAHAFDHILVAIVPQQEKAWFFKLSGPATAIDRQRMAFIEFLSTVEVSASNDEPPTWQLPEGWEEKPASAMRVATLVIPYEQGPDEQGELELAISSLPMPGPWEEFLTPNVNRWLGQLSRPPLSTETILGLAKKIETKDGRATLVELSGRLSSSRRANPHAGMNMTTPPSAAPLSYEAPDDWQPGRTSSFRKAAFEVVEGQAKAEVTVIDFPASGGAQIADVAANVKRWAGQVGLTSLDAAALDHLTETITIDGIKGTYVELLGPTEGEQPMAIVGAMLTRSDKVWFFKLAGDRSLVERQQATFREFLASVRFRSP